MIDVKGDKNLTSYTTPMSYGLWRFSWHVVKTTLYYESMLSIILFIILTIVVLKSTLSLEMLLQDFILTFVTSLGFFGLFIGIPFWLTSSFILNLFVIRDQVREKKTQKNLKYWLSPILLQLLINTFVIIVGSGVYLAIAMSTILNLN